MKIKGRPIGSALTIHFICCVFFVLVFFHVGAQSTVDTVPNEKLVNGSYVSNPDKILNQSTVFSIDTILQSLENKSAVQVAVVSLNSIGDADPVDFAQALFDKWGIGKEDRGVLLLLVRDVHHVRFQTGYGVEGILPDIVCKRIQRDYMVPHFKKDDYNSGMLAGVQNVSRVFSDPRYAEELKMQQTDEVSDWAGFITFLCVFVAPLILLIFILKVRNGKFSDLKSSETTAYPEMRLTKWRWLLLNAGLPIIIITLFGTGNNPDAPALCFLSLYMYYMTTLTYRMYREKQVINRFLKTEEYYEIVEFIRSTQWYWFGMAVAFPIPFAIYFFYHLARKRMYRNHPRRCKLCEGKMRKLNELAEDEYLTDGQKMEETLRSVDYDVWRCQACQAIGAWFYLNRHSTYEVCPKCDTIAYHSVSKHTIINPTYSSAGSGEELRACKFCSFQKKSSYSISRLTRATSSSGTSSSSFGSSSSGGGSWGGGRSGGGGASSTW
jgi:uncharacterized protein